MANVIDICTEAIKAITPPVFKEVWTFDRAAVNRPPGVTMGYMGAKKVDDLGVRATAHRRKWRHTIIVRLWVRMETANSQVHDQEVRSNIAAFVDAIEADPTLGGRVVAAGVADVGEPTLLANQVGKIVGKAVDVTVFVDLYGSWQ